MIPLLFSGLLAWGPAIDAGQRVVEPAWTHQFDGGIVDLSVPAGGNCFAVLTTGSVTVMTFAGEVRWQRDLSRLSRVFQAASIAVAPSSCEWVVVLGTNAYRFAWIFRRDGSQAHLGFKGETPLAAAVSPDERRVAIATGGSRLYVADAALSVSRVVRFDVVGSVAYSPDGSHLMLSGYGHGMASADGTRQWSQPGGVCAISYPVNVAWSVSACSPPHLSSTGIVAVRDTNGRERWSSILDSPQAAAAPDGSFLAVVGADVSVREGREAAGALKLTIRQPDGTMLFEMPQEPATLLGVTGDGSIVVRQHEAAEWRWYTSRGRLIATARVGGFTTFPGVIGGPRRMHLLVADDTRLFAFAVASN